MRYGKVVKGHLTDRQLRFKPRVEVVTPGWMSTERPRWVRSLRPRERLGLRPKLSSPTSKREAENRDRVA